MQHLVFGDYFNIYCLELMDAQQLATFAPFKFQHHHCKVKILDLQNSRL
jgi:hypothetical protein